MKHHSLMALGLLAAAAAAPAQAFDLSSQQYSARIGVTQIRPDVDSGNLSAPSLPGTRSDVKPATSLSGGITWWADDNVAVDVPLAIPFKHDIVGAGTIAGVGKLGTVRVLPATVFLQYHFGQPSDPVRFFVGAGPTYAYFYDHQASPTLSALTGRPGTTFKVDSKLTGTVEVGASVRLTDAVSLNAMVAKTLLKTKTTLSTGQSQDIRLDPLTVSLGVAYRF